MNIEESLYKHFQEDLINFGKIDTALQTINLTIGNHTKAAEAFHVSQEKAHADLKGEYMEVKLAIAKLSKEMATRDEMKPMIETFGNLKWGEKVLIKIGIFIGALVSVTLGILEIIKLTYHK